MDPKTQAARYRQALRIAADELCEVLADGVPCGHDHRRWCEALHKLRRAVRAIMHDTYRAAGLTCDCPDCPHCVDEDTSFPTPDETRADIAWERHKASRCE